MSHPLHDAWVFSLTITSAFLTRIYLLFSILTDVELSKLDERLIQILAWQRLQQLVPAKGTSLGKKGTLNGLLSPAGRRWWRIHVHKISNMMDIKATSDFFPYIRLLNVLFFSPLLRGQPS